MFIHNRIYEKAKKDSENLTIKDVRIGLGYTIVELDNGFCGLSYSFVKELNAKTCTALEYAGSLVGKKAHYLLEKIFSYNLLDSTLALATANAILNKEENSVDYDIISHIDNSKSVVMVGYFSPLIPIIEKKAKKFVICERNPKGNSLPDYAEYFELKKCDIAIVSATTLINKTIDNILDISRAETFVILGPSCPMDREIFRSTKVTYLCGSFVTDIQKAKTIISEGGGTQKLKVATKKGCVLCQS